MGEATEEMVAKAVKVVTSVKLTEAKEGEKRAPLTSSTSSEVLVVPQATLGGRLKGNSVQYHGNVKVEDGARLYDMFCTGLGEKLGEERVKRGRFGARQILSTITSGPYSHTFDIS
jgi:D-Tyr-tRNAtyr deacylase